MYALIADFPKLQLFAQIAVSIFLEAAPFLLFGSLLSALLEVFLDPASLTRLAPKGRVAGVGLGLVAGMALPTCECGVVPVARRLLDKGLPPQTALTYMLCAPVINPVVLASTYIAFQGSLTVVAARVVMVALPAALLGLTLGGLPSRVLLRKPGFQPTPLILDSAQVAAMAHPAGCGCGADHAAPGTPRWRSVLDHTAGEFLQMGKYLILGCLAAAAFKIFLPWEILSSFENNIFLAVALMMLLAVLLSVCSEADAFVAASFVSLPLGAKLSFLALGPMVDLKLIGMYFSAFHQRVAIALIIVPVIIIYPLSLFMQGVLP